MIMHLCMKDDHCSQTNFNCACQRSCFRVAATSSFTQSIYGERVPRPLTTTTVDDLDHVNGGGPLVARPDLPQRAPLHHYRLPQSLTYLLDGCHFNPLAS